MSKFKTNYNSDEYNEGYEAARMGNGHNPYPAFSNKHYAWFHGWDNYFADMADKQSSERYGF